MNVLITKKVLCLQEQIVKNAVDDLRIVVSSFFENLDVNIDSNLNPEDKYTLGKIFKFFLNEIDCFFSSAMHFVKNLFP